MAQVDPERFLVVDGSLTIEQIHSVIVERVSSLTALKKNVKS
jgi:dTMP kinase